MSAEREAGRGGGGEEKEKGGVAANGPLLPEVILVSIALCD